jgi:hypothetical protein
MVRSSSKKGAVLANRAPFSLVALAATTLRRDRPVDRPAAEHASHRTNTGAEQLVAATRNAITD